MKTGLIIRSNRRGVFSAQARTLLQWSLAVYLLAGGLIGCGSVNEIPPPTPPQLAEQTPAPIPSPSPRAAKKNPAVRLPRVEAALKKAVAARLNSWKTSIETRDMDKHLQHYADQIDIYYLALNVNRDFVRADRQRGFEQFDQLKVLIINVEVNLEASDAAVVTFDKSWDFRRGANFSDGLVQQEILMRKIEKQWFITSERDLEIYRYRNN